jgi:hypothetical protein
MNRCCDCKHSYMAMGGSLLCKNMLVFTAKLAVTDRSCTFQRYGNIPDSYKHLVCGQSGQWFEPITQESEK